MENGKSECKLGGSDDDYYDSGDLTVRMAVIILVAMIVMRVGWW